MLLDKQLKPYQKIIKQCRKSLEKLVKDTKSLNQVNWFWKEKGYEDSLRKVKSRLEAWEEILSHQAVDFRLRVKQELKTDLLAIEKLSKQINEQIAQKRWLKDKMNQTNSTVKIISRVLKVVSAILALLGIEVGALLLLAQEAVAAARRVLLPGKDESSGCA